MNDSSIIDELNNVFTTDLRMPAKYYALGDRIDKTRKNIVNQSYSKNRKNLKKNLETLCNDYEEMSSMEFDTYFCKRFFSCSTDNE